MSNENRLGSETRWNMHEVLNRFGKDTYRDYEGFVDEVTKELVIRKVVEITQNVEHYEDGKPVPEFKRLLRDILSNLLLERIDVEGISLDEDAYEYNEAYVTNIVITMVDVVIELISVTEWTRSGIDWDAEEYRVLSGS